MKYKDLKSMAHNFTHSFVSYVNYIDGRYVIEDLRKVLVDSESTELVIRWIPKVGCEARLPEHVQRSIGYWGDHLPEHLKSHKVDREHIATYETRLFMTPRTGMAVESVLVDDRGKEYRQRVAH